MDTPQTETSTPVKKGIARRMYDWVLSWADTPYGTPALAVISFAESSFFPIPPDVLQIALSAAKPSRSFYYATVSLIASVLGAILGYYIGSVLWNAVDQFFYTYVFNEEVFRFVESKYADNAFLAIITAAFTIIPFKVFTIAAGACKISLPVLIFASLLGRGMRFYLVATLVSFFGPGIRKWIEKYFEIFAVLFCVLLIAGFFLVKVLLKP